VVVLAPANPAFYIGHSKNVTVLVFSDEKVAVSADFDGFGSIDLAHVEGKTYSAAVPDFVPKHDLWTMTVTLKNDRGEIIHWHKQLLSFNGVAAGYPLWGALLLLGDWVTWSR